MLIWQQRMRKPLAAGATLKVHDEFTDAAGTLLSSHVPTVLGTGWTQERIPDANRRMGITATNTAGKFAGGILGDGWNYYSVQPDPTVANQQLEFNYAVEGGTNDDPVVGFLRASAGNLAAGGSCYAVGCYTDKTRLWKLVSGVITQLSQVGDVLAGSLVRFVVNGSALEVFDDDVSIIAVTDTSVTQVGKWGMGLGSLFNQPGAGLGDDISAQEFDSFKAWEIT